MVRRFAGTLAVFVMCTALAAAARAQHGGGQGPVHMSPAPVAIELPAGGLTLPMQDWGGRPVIEAKVNGKGPYRFILDTGATMTVIDVELRDVLKLPAVKGMTAAAAHGPAPALVTVDRLALGGATLRGVTVALMPLGKMLTGEQRPMGVLSALAFPGHLVTFDYPGRKIAIAKGKLEATDSGTTFAYSAEEPIPTVPLRIGGHDTRVHLDTGSGYGVMLPTRFMDELTLTSKPEPAGNAKVHGGESPIMKARVEGAIEVGAHKLDLADVSFVDLKPMFGAPMGLIGYEVLRKFVVTLDSRNRLVRISG